VAGVQDSTHGHTLTPAFELSDMPAPLSSNASVTLDGPPVPPQGRIQLYSSDEWEGFIREWITGLKTEYVQIKRFGGSGDKGADIAAFKSDNGLEGPPNGYTRLSSVLSQVGQLDLNRHKLITVSDIDDRKVICHQLANADRLTWVQ
jgi:hypothetical protein